MLDFVAERASSVRRVVLTNSEGYWSDEGDFVNLQQKHTFSLGHVGLLLGSVRSTLEDLRVSHCSDIFSGFSRGALGMVACCPKLKVLRMEDVHTRLERDALAQLGKLTALEELAVSVEDNLGSWAVGLDAIPESWRSLKRLRKLKLRGHVQLAALPRWLPELEELEEIDLSGCCHCDLSSSSSSSSFAAAAAAGGGGGGSVLQRCVGLRVVSLSGMRLTDPLPPPPPPRTTSPAASTGPVALFGEAAAGGANPNNTSNPATQPQALAAAIESANADAAAAEQRAAAVAAAALRVPAAIFGGMRVNAAADTAAAGGNRGGNGNGDLDLDADDPDGNERVPPAVQAALDALVRTAPGDHAPGARLRELMEQRRLAAGGVAPPQGAALRAAFAAANDALEARDARETAALDAHDFVAEAAARTAAAATAAARRALPDLSSLPRLEALNLAENALTRLPHFLPKLGRSLRFLDLSGNGGLKFPVPLVPGTLSSLPRLRALDARGAHAEAGLGYWSEEKCASMRHLCALAKAGKRRRPWRLRVFMDKE